MPVELTADVDAERLRRNLAGSMEMDEARRALAVAEVSINAMDEAGHAPLVSAALLLVRRAQRILASAAEPG